MLQIDHEDAHGQYELNFGFDEALVSADHLMLFKQAAHALAEARGMVFSMMPKPFANQPGSGMHMHVSLWSGWNASAATTRSACSCRTAPTAASTASAAVAIGEQFVAGVLAHSRGADGVGRAHRQFVQAAARRRVRVRHTLGPGLVAHGPNNRTARDPHPAWSLRMARAAMPAPTRTWPPPALIAAGLDGIDRKLDPARGVHRRPVRTAVAEQAAERGLARLPQRLGEALDALAADEVIRVALGDTLSREFIAAEACGGRLNTATMSATGNCSAMPMRSDHGPRRRPVSMPRC